MKNGQVIRLKVTFRIQPKEFIIPDDQPGYIRLP